MRRSIIEATHREQLVFSGVRQECEAYACSTGKNNHVCQACSATITFARCSSVCLMIQSTAFPPEVVDHTALSHKVNGRVLFGYDHRADFL